MRKNHYVVLGAGMGEAIAYLLATLGDTATVAISDETLFRASSCAQKINSLTRLNNCYGIEFHVENSDCRTLFKSKNVVISALPAKFNVRLAEEAIDAGVDFCDLGGVVSIASQILQLDKKAVNAGVSVITGVGISPGMVDIFARMLMKPLDQVGNVTVIAAGLPQKPQPPLFYNKVYSIEGLKHIVYDTAPVVVNGRIQSAQPFSYYETLDVPELAGFSPTQKGTIEIFATAGADTSPWDYQDLGVLNFFEKTGRWVDEGGNGFVSFVRSIPKDRFEETTKQHIDTPTNSQNPDLIWMRVEVTGQIHGEPITKTISMLDLFDDRTNLSAMQRTTGFTAAKIAQYAAQRKTLNGAKTPGNALDWPAQVQLYLDLSKHFNFILS